MNKISSTIINNVLKIIPIKKMNNLKNDLFKRELNKVMEKNANTCPSSKENRSNDKNKSKSKLSYSDPNKRNP